MAVRSIPRNGRSVTGRMPVRGQKAVAFESTLERDFALVTQFRQGFVALEEQPVRIPVSAPQRSYVPDFLVTWASPKPTDLVEVKHLADLEAHRSQLAPKFAAAESYAGERGWRFVVATEREIRTPLLGNAKFLLPYRTRPVDPGHSARLLSCLAAEGPLTAGRLLDAAIPGEAQVAALPALWRLIATFRVGADLKAPLTMDTVLAVEDICHEQT